MVEASGRKGEAQKIVVLGEARVGKTSLTLRFVKNQFDKEQDSTIDASFLSKKVSVGEKSVNLNIWDTAGQEKYHALAKNYYQGASGAVLVYDVTDLDSFAKAKTWYSELRKYIGPDAPIVIAGNKSDKIDKLVKEDEADAYARSVGIEHIATSALSGMNVTNIFLSIASSKYFIHSYLCQSHGIRGLTLNHLFQKSLKMIRNRLLTEVEQDHVLERMVEVA